MIRDWRKGRRREAARRTAAEERERAAFLVDLEIAHEQKSKDELRAEAAEAVAAYRGPVRRLPTVIDLRCICGHRGRVTVAPGRPRPKCRCRRCGARI